MGIDPERYANEELIDLLFQEEDRLTQPIITELIRRGAELIPDLAAIVMDRGLWTADLPDWWAPIHATYILGAIGGDEVVVPLLAALRWSDAYDNEWVTEDLPAIFGRLGEMALEPLLTVAADRSAGWSARSIAVDSLAAIAVVRPQFESRLIRFISQLLAQRREDPGVRLAAAMVLLDLRYHAARADLIAFAKEEVHAGEINPDYRPVLNPADVERELAITIRAEDYYRRDWLMFYDDEERARRELRWREEENNIRQRERGVGERRRGEKLH